MLSGLAALLSGCSPEPVEERVRLDAQFVNVEGAPLAQSPVRIVVGDIADAREPSAGQTVTTDGAGRIDLDVVAPVKTRRITLDNMFARHRTQFLEIGVELELRGKPALYWIELDMLKEGALAGISAYVQAPDGRFSRRLAFHDATRSWSFPDQPDGMLMSDIGANIRRHDMTGSVGGPWKIDLVIEKQEFTVR